MVPPRKDAHGTGALESIANELAPEADAFTPEVDSVPTAAPHLPGRRRGAALAEDAKPTSGPEAVLLDIGTSRRDGFSHVLWVSGSAGSMTLSGTLESLDTKVATVDGVTGVEWEGSDHLHVNAPDRDHSELLRDARAAVAELLA